MKEGVPRYLPQTAFPERDLIPMFRQIRDFDENLTYLCPLRKVPLHVQDIIAAAVDINITKSMIGLYRYCTGQFDEQDREHNMKQAFKNLRQVLKPMEEFRGQSHEALLSDIINSMDNLINGRGLVRRISRTASGYGILRPFILLSKSRAELLRGDPNALFPSKDEVSKMPSQQQEIIATGAYFTQWEALRKAKVPEYSGGNPFGPLLDLVENGYVGISVDIRKGRNVYTTKPYREEPLTNIAQLLAA